MIKKISVIGLGTIGHAVACHFAIHGYEVSAYDLNPAVYERAFKSIRAGLEVFAEEGLVGPDCVDEIAGRIIVADSLEQAVRDADYVIENINENLAAKQELFRELERLCGPSAIFASNTSSLKLADITGHMSPGGKTRAMLCHWFNPGHIIPLVELSFFGNMPEDIYLPVESLYLNTGKQPVKVLKDIPGLVANRIQHAVAREVLSMVEKGVASAGDVDRAFQFGPAFRCATTGPLAAADFNGLDVWCTVEDNLLPDLDRSVEANPILREKVRQGKLGVKSGEGFFAYPEAKRAETKNAFDRRLIRQLKTSMDYLKD